MTAVDLRFVVIGSGRSGTAWAARQLTERGIVCGHESVFDWHPSTDPGRRLDYPGRTPSPHEPPDDEVLLEADASLAAIAHLAQLPAGCNVWHVARDPRQVIDSWAVSGILGDLTGSPYGRFIAAHVPAVAAEGDLVGRAARWVAEWNLRGRAAAQALRLPYRLDRIEDGDGDVVNRHRIGDAGLTWETIARCSTIATAELLGEWATVAGYGRT